MKSNLIVRQLKNKPSSYVLFFADWQLIWMHVIVFLSWDPTNYWNVAGTTQSAHNITDGSSLPCGLTHLTVICPGQQRFLSHMGGCPPPSSQEFSRGDASRTESYFLLPNLSVSVMPRHQMPDLAPDAQASDAWFSIRCPGIWCPGIRSCTRFLCSSHWSLVTASWNERWHLELYHFWMGADA